MKVAVSLVVAALIGAGLFLLSTNYGETSSRYATVTKAAKNPLPAPRVTRSASFTNKQSAEAVFALFSAEEGKDWFPNWDYINLSGRLDMREEDVFMTPPHGHGATNSVWVVKTIDSADFFLELIRMNPVHRVALSETETRVDLSISDLALSETGESFVRFMTERRRPKWRITGKL